MRILRFYPKTPQPPIPSFLWSHSPSPHWLQFMCKYGTIGLYSENVYFPT